MEAEGDCAAVTSFDVRQRVRGITRANGKQWYATQVLHALGLCPGLCGLGMAVRRCVPRLDFRVVAGYLPICSAAGICDAPDQFGGGGSRGRELRMSGVPGLDVTLAVPGSS